jgi:hypothetical protein
MTTTTETIDETRVQEFAGEIFGIYTGAMLSAMIDIGHRTDCSRPLLRARPAAPS